MSREWVFQMNNAGYMLQQSQQQGSGTQQQSPKQPQQQSSDLKGPQGSTYAQQSRGPAGVGSALDGLVKGDAMSGGGASGAGSANTSHAYSATSSSYQSNYQSQKSTSSGYQPSVAYNASSNYSASQVRPHARHELYFCCASGNIWED